MALKGTEKERMRSMEAVLASCSRRMAMVSAKKYKTALHNRDRGMEILSPNITGRKEGRLSVAAVSATSLEMAVWYPAAVRAKERDSTGLNNW